PHPQSPLNASYLHRRSPIGRQAAPQAFRHSATSCSGCSEFIRCFPRVLFTVLTRCDSEMSPQQPSSLHHLRVAPLHVVVPAPLSFDFAVLPCLLAVAVAQSGGDVS
ncbi:unnamed protein product, partial [Ixodes pacificus]